MPPGSIYRADEYLPVRKRTFMSLCVQVNKTDF